MASGHIRREAEDCDNPPLLVRRRVGFLPGTQISVQRRTDLPRRPDRTHLLIGEEN